jgi:hypothetical protein
MDSFVTYCVEAIFDPSVDPDIPVIADKCHGVQSSEGGGSVQGSKCGCAIA